MLGKTDNKRRLLPLPLFLAVSLGCALPWTATEAEWTVLAHHSPAWQRGGFDDERKEWKRTPHMFFVENGHNAVPWEFAPDRLRKFEPKWGTEYKIRVRSEVACLAHIEIGPAHHQTVVEVLEERSMAGTEFTLQSIGLPWFDADRRGFVDGQKFSCTPEVCGKLDAALQNTDARFDLQMRHGASGAIELLAVQSPTCTTATDCAEPPLHGPQNMCCRGTCTGPGECKGDPWRSPDAGT